MAKANKKAQELESVNHKFDEIYSVVDDLADSVESIMPLVADSLRFTKKLIKLYQKAFNSGLQ